MEAARAQDQDLHEQELLAKTIRANFLKLVEHTTCTVKLLNMCWSQEVLTEHERQEIEATATPDEKSTKFYHLLKLKDATTIGKTIEILRVYNSSRVPYEIFKNACGLEEPARTADAKAGTTERDCAFAHARNVCADVLSAQPKPPIRTFFGRQEEMQALHEMFINTAAEEVHIVCVTGLGGVGKSELARAYAQKYRQFYDGNCIWINADCASSIQESVFAIAGDLDIPIQTNQGRPRLLRAIVANVYKRLAPVRCLVIFDNVEEFKGQDGVTMALPNLPPDVAAPWILMTSRVTNWALVDSFQVQEFPLKVPSLHESTQFIQKQLGLVTEEELQLGEKLCAEMQCHPLWLQHAAAYIGTDVRRLGSTAVKTDLLRDYMTRCQKQERVFADARYEKMSDRYDNTLMTTLSLTMEKIRVDEKDEHAILWLNTLAFRRPFDIPESNFIRDTIVFGQEEECLQILRSVFGLSMDEQDHHSVHQSLNMLANYSMIRIEEGLISFHHLVGQVLMFQLRGEQKEESILRLIVQPLTRLPSSEFDRRRVEICKYWQHCLSYDQLIKAFSSCVGVRVNQDGLFNYPLEDTVKRFEKVLGACHRDTLATKLLCAVQYNKPAYIEQLPALLRDCEQSLGHEDKITLGVCRAIVNDHIKAKRYKDALMFAQSRLDLEKSYDTIFEYASDMVLYSMAKEDTTGSMLEEVAPLYDTWRRETSLESADSIHWISFRGTVVLLLLLGVEKRAEALRILNTELEPHRTETGLKHVRKNYAEILSFMNKTEDMDALFKNLLQFWDISAPDASDKKKYADWWLQLNEEISICHEKYIELNQVFGQRVNLREDFNKFVPYGFTMSMEDFLLIDAGITRYKRATEYLVLISVRDLECDKELKKMPVNSELMDNIQAVLSLDSRGGLESHLKYIFVLLEMHYNWKQIAEWENGKFLIFLMDLAKKMTSSAPSNPAPAPVVKVLQFLHMILHAGGVKIVPIELVKGLISLAVVPEGVGAGIEHGPVSLPCKVFQILVSLTNNNDCKVLAEEDVQTLAISLRKCCNVDCSDQKDGSGFDSTEQRKWIIWIFSNLAESNVLAQYACLNSILEGFAELVGSDDPPQASLQNFFVHSTILFTLFAYEQDQSQSRNSAHNKLDPCLKQNLLDRAMSNLRGWIRNPDTFDFFKTETIDFESLDCFLRLLTHQHVLDEQRQHDHSPGPYILFATWTLAALLNSAPDRYAPMVLGWPGCEWWELFSKLEHSCEGAAQRAVTIIMEIMLAKYSVPVFAEEQAIH